MTSLCRAPSHALYAIGFVGVFALAACEGDQGPTGPAGPQGVAGPVGPAGPQGLPPSAPAPDRSGTWTRNDTTFTSFTFPSGTSTATETRLTIRTGSISVRFVGGNSYAVTGTTTQSDTVKNSTSPQPLLAQTSTFTNSFSINIAGDLIYGFLNVPIPASAWTATALDVVYTDPNTAPCRGAIPSGITQPQCRFAFHWRRTGP